MKLLSLPTIYTTPDNYEVDGDVTLFFEFTDEQYERLINTHFDDIWQVLDACLGWSSNYWNLQPFSNNDRLKPDTSAFEHTTRTDVYFFPI
jgi:hypothetical protein